MAVCAYYTPSEYTEGIASVRVSSGRSEVQGRPAVPRGRRRQSAARRRRPRPSGGRCRGPGRSSRLARAPLHGARPGSPAPVRDADHRAAALRASTPRRTPCPRGVGEHVADERVDRGHEVVGGTRTGSGARPGRPSSGRPWSSASADQNATRSGHDRHRVAGRRHALADGPAGLADDPVDRRSARRRRPCSRSRSAGGSASASRRSAVSGVRSRWDRSATTSRSAASSSPIRSASRLNAAADVPTSGGPAGVDARGEVARAQPARRSRPAR